MNNVKLKPYSGVSPWRKIAMASWKTVGDPSVYGAMEFRAEPMLKLIEDYRQKGIRLTVTHVMTKAVARALKAVPEANAILRMGRVYLRDEINIFLQTATDKVGEDLTGFVLYNADKKSLEEISAICTAKASVIKDKKDPTFLNLKRMFRFMPVWLIRLCLNITSFFTLNLNMSSRLFGLPNDAMGGVMVTSVGMLGIQEGFAPIVPYSRVSLLLAVGQVQDKPIVNEQGQVVAAKIIRVNGTIDHRVVDGVQLARAAMVMREYLDAPY